MTETTDCTHPECEHGLRRCKAHREVCGECAKAKWLQVAEMWPHLHAYVEPRGTSETKIRTPPASRPPVAVAPLSLIQEISDWAWFYASALMDETHDYVVRPGTVSRLHDIATRYGHFTTAPDRTAMDYCDMADHLWRRARATLAVPATRRFMGTCMTGEGCEGDVYLADGARYATCDKCGSGHDEGQLREQLSRALEGRLLRRDELREALNIVKPHGAKRVSPELLRKWIQRGRLVPAMAIPGPKGSDVELFRLTDAMDLAGIESAVHRRVS